MIDACTIMSSCEYFQSRGGVDEKSVGLAEASLGLTFADDYKEYLHRFGAADYYGHELTGLNAPARIDVVQTTREAWASNPDVPHNMYVIEEPHIDGVVFWQDATGTVFESIPFTTPVKQFLSLADYVEKTK